MYLGIDIGTQSLKAIIVDEALRQRGAGSSPYQPHYPRPGWAEQNPDLWLSALRPAIAGALANAGAAPEDVRGMALCGQLDGCIGVSANGQAVAPAIIWMDRRAIAECEGVDPALIRDRAGLVLDATHMAAKIRWAARNLERAGEVAVWHQPVSFVLETLTGSRAIDHSLASTTMLYGLAARSWDDELLSAFDIDPATLPSVAGAADRAGTLSGRGAELTGLRRGLPVATGTGDDFSNPLGCGISSPGVVSVTLGTGEAVGGLSETLVIDPDMLVETHVYPAGHHHLGNPGWLSGGAVRWFLDVFSIPNAAEMSRLAEGVPPGSEGLLFLPALSGAMAPRWEAKARGCFYGMTAAHTTAHFARAIFEGTSFAMRDVVDRLAALGVAADRLRLLGGGTASEVWTQMRADLTGTVVEALEEGDSSAMGAAMLAVVAAGDATDVRSVCDAAPLQVRRVDPIAANRAVYEESYRRYRALFASLEPMFT